MTISAFVGADGSARLVLDGHEMKLRADTTDEVRAVVMEHARRYAEQTGAPQSFTALEATGEWAMVVYPTGEVLPAPAAPPAPPPPRPRAPVPPRTPSDAPAPIHRPPAPAVPLERVTEDPAAVIEPEDHTVRAVNRAPAVEETVLRPRRRTVTIAVDGAAEEEMVAPVLIGRRPRPRRDHMLLSISSPGQEVSRVHAVIDVDDRGTVVIVDQDSVNGTFIDGVLVQANTVTPVPEGAVLQLGDVRLRVRR